MAIIALKRNATVEDLIEQMHNYLPNHIAQMEAFQPVFKSPSLYQTGKKIFDFLKTIKYKADGKRQIIRSPYRLIMSNKGDCKSYSIFAASALLSFGAKVRFVYSTATNPNEPEHVYVQFMSEKGLTTLDGTICCYDKIPKQVNEFVGEWMQLQ